MVRNTRRFASPSARAALSLSATSVQRSPSRARQGGRENTASGTPTAAQAARAFAEMCAANGCVASITRSIRGFGQVANQSIDAAKTANARREDQRRTAL